MVRSDLPDDSIDATFQLAIALSQRVELKLAYDSADDVLPGAAAGNKFLTMRQIDFGDEHPQERIDHGLKRMYVYGAPDIDLQCTLTVAKNMIGELIRRGTRSDEGILSAYKYKMKVTNNDDSSAELSMDAYLYRKRIIKPDGEGQQTVDLQCSFMIADHEAVAVD